MSSILKYLSALLPSPRKNAPPDVRKWLEKYGKYRIKDLEVCRIPIDKNIYRFLNLALFNDLQNKGYTYDKLFHLFMYIKLSDGSMWSIEKNEVVRIEKVKEKRQSESCKLLRNELTKESKPILNDLFKNAITLDPDVYIYDAKYHNCQDFLITLLKSAGLLDKDMEKYIKQDAAKLLPSYIQTFAKEVTDIASGFDVVLHGAGAEH